MKLGQLIRKLLAAEGKSETAGSRDVIVVVDGAPMPYPDVTGISVNEDTVVIEARVFQDGEAKP